MAVRLPLFPTSVVGSFPRPSWLMKALRDLRAGRITPEEFEEYLDDAVVATIKEEEVAGLDVITDGEQRRLSFFFAELFDGMEYKPLYQLAETPDARSYLESMGIHRGIYHPVASGLLGLRLERVEREAGFALKYASKPLKFTLPSPYMLMIDSWNKKLSSDYYPAPEDLGFEVARLLNKAVRRLAEMGVFFVQLDDPSLSNPIDPKYYRLVELVNGYKPRQPIDEELSLAVELINEAVRGVSGVKLGVHVCRGNWPGPEEALPRGGYERIMPYLNQLRVDQLVLEFATPRAGSLEVLREAEKEVGLGVVDVKRPEVESPRLIASRAREALRHLDPGRLWLNPDCGFASGATWPVQPRRRSFEKVRAMVEAAWILRREYEGRA